MIRRRGRPWAAAPSYFDFTENDRGRFIKITEDVRGRRDTIMLPMEQAEEFADALQRILSASREMGEHQ